MAPVGDRDHSRDHLVLVALQGQVRRQQRSESGEGVKERIRNQTVRIDDAGCLAVERRMNRRGVLDWVQVSLCFRRPRVLSRPRKPEQS